MSSVGRWIVASTFSVVFLCQVLSISGFVLPETVHKEDDTLLRDKRSSVLDESSMEGNAVLSKDEAYLNDLIAAGLSEEALLSNQKMIPVNLEADRASAKQQLLLRLLQDESKTTGVVVKDSKDPLGKRKKGGRCYFHAVNCWWWRQQNIPPIFEIGQQLFNEKLWIASLL